MFQGVFGHHPQSPGGNITDLAASYYNKSQTDALLSDGLPTEAHTHQEAGITDLDKYTKAQTELKILRIQTTRACTSFGVLILIEQSCLYLKKKPPFSQKMRKCFDCQGFVDAFSDFPSLKEQEKWSAKNFTLPIRTNTGL